MLLAWEFRGSQPIGEDETVALEPDGTTWLWVRVPADPDRGDVVGTFRATAAPQRVAEVRDLARRLAASTDDEAGDAHRGSVSVSGSGVARRLPLRGASGVAGEAVRLGRELAAAAFAEPLAAVRFSARAMPSLDPALLAGVDPNLLPEILKPSAEPGVLLGIVVDALGSRPTGLVLAADRLQAHWRAGDRAVGWTELPAPGVGLTGDGFYDGIRSPARIPPGGSAALSVKAALTDEAADGVVVRVTGKVELIGPWDELGAPTARFEASSRPVSLGRPAG
jgi:hypothetical protein